MEEFEIKTPLYYVMGNKSEPFAVERLLSTTPCCCGVACSHQERLLLEPFVYEVFRANDSKACAELAVHLARTFGRPVLIIGQGTHLTAVYSTGEEETLC